ncbi:hypothetical protein HYPSUDRAFT_51139 [Hypholoma sublateritium FD-334 SS-4]|uniref:Uncharacterized protein n=1 Tax=Hypholoma sublateritium (strain FD-334 SS-4) TaxID=945553 RepID=A0A0D2MWB7_HYPSF|nr:hypothetical protein HYPSUDRAFT_51139 [Hypholoma sublateritium FD-334 SS-4]
MKSSSAKPIMIEPSLCTSPTQDSCTVTVAVGVQRTDIEDLNLNSIPTSCTNAAAPTKATPKKRKAPHCTKCKHPRQGHPRSGCPFVNLPQPTANVSAILEIRPMLTEATDGGGAMVLSGAQTLTQSELESPVLSRASLKGAAVKPSLSGVFHSKGDEVLIEPKRLRESLATATATAIPSTENGPKNSKSKLPMWPDMSSTVPHILLSAADLPQKQELLSAGPVRCGNGDDMKLEELQENFESDQAVPYRRALEPISQSLDLLALILCEQAPATIFIVPNVTADTGTVLDQASALKFRIDLTANRSDGLERLNAPIVLNNEAITSQAIISAAMTGAANNDRSVLLHTGGLSAIVLAVAAATAVGAIGAWAALAFV